MVTKTKTILISSLSMSIYHLCYSCCLFAASIGGTLGVGIGASLLTLFEFVEFGMLQLIKLCNKRASSTRRINVAGAIGQANSVI